MVVAAARGTHSGLTDKLHDPLQAMTRSTAKVMLHRCPVIFYDLLCIYYSGMIYYSGSTYCTYMCTRYKLPGVPVVHICVQFILFYF